MSNAGGKRRWPMALLAGGIGVALGAVGGLSYATGTLPGQVNLIHQAKQMQQMGELAWYIESFAYEEADNHALYLGASRGMVGALDDRYAAYYTAEEFDEMMAQQSGEYVGIGIVIAQDGPKGDILIDMVYDDTPAALAGIKIGDAVTAFDGESLAGKSAQDLTDMIRQKKETLFTLSIQRDSLSFDVELHSEPIVVHRVHFAMKDGIAVIDLDEFTGDAQSGFSNALEQARKQAAKGIVIDLRDNPGGDLNIVLGIADELLGEGVTMTMKSRTGQEQVYQSDANKKTNLPLAVLINGRSASASEVLAGALQDHGAARLFGVTSFGKGIVQSIYPLQLSQGHVKLTTAAYFTPSGRSIHGTGIEPDVVVKLPKAYREKLIQNLPEEKDTQMQAAMKYLQGLAAPKEPGAAGK